MHDARATVLVPPFVAGFPRVLVVDNHDGDRHALAASLRREGFIVEATGDGEEALGFLDSFDPLLVLLEMSLPGMPGLDVCRAIRERSHVPVIFVTTRGSELDAVLGLEVGADDYVVKPFRSRELVARIRAVLRRSIRDRSGWPPAEIIEVDGLRLNRSKYELCIDSQPVPLPLREFRLLELLLLNAGRVVERRDLIKSVWGEYDGAGKTLDTHIKRLRARIEGQPGHPTRIRTIRGVGFCFEVPD
jgi:two-component system response regulator RegX3